MHVCVYRGACVLGNTILGAGGTLMSEVASQGHSYALHGPNHGDPLPPRKEGPGTHILKQSRRKWDPLEPKNEGQDE